MNYISIFNIQQPSKNIDLTSFTEYMIYNIDSNDSKYDKFSELLILIGLLPTFYWFVYFYISIFSYFLYYLIWIFDKILFTKTDLTEIVKKTYFKYMRFIFVAIFVFISSFGIWFLSGDINQTKLFTFMFLAGSVGFFLNYIIDICSKQEKNKRIWLEIMSSQQKECNIISFIYFLMFPLLNYQFILFYICILEFIVLTTISFFKIFSNDTL